MRIALISVDVRLASMAKRRREQAAVDCLTIANRLGRGARVEDELGRIEVAAEAASDALECTILAGMGVALH